MSIQVNTDPRTLPDARAELTRVAAEVVTLETTVTNLQSVKVEDTQPFLDLRAQLDAASLRATSAEGSLVVAQQSLTTKDGEIQTLTGKVTAAEEAVKEFDLKVDKAATTKATDFIASKGLGPLSLGAAIGDDKKETKLTGRARAAAQFDKELAK